MGQHQLVKGTIFLRKNKKWKEYFGVFQASHRTLWLFETALDYLQRNQPKKEVSLHGCKVQVDYDIDPTAQPYMKNIIRITRESTSGLEDSSAEPHFLCCVDEVERARWSEALEDSTFSGRLSVTATLGGHRASMIAMTS